MDADQVADFFGVMLIGGAVGTVAATASSRWRPQLAAAALPIAALVAVGAMTGSLYFSESAGFEPCELCWFQRIFMYPLAVILPLAAWRRDVAIAPYALVLSLAGLGISVYHIQLQLFPDQGTFCELTNPCSGKWVEALGWMTIPQMAGLSFAIIATLTTLALFQPIDDLPEEHL